MTARVVPEFVSEETFNDITDEFTSPVVVASAANFGFTVTGNVQNALDSVLPDLRSDGWTLREEITDIRDNSAFITLRKDGIEMHVIIDGETGNANVRIQQREPVCGPTFDIP